MTDEPILAVDDLRVSFAGGAREVVRGVSFALGRGESLGLVGESGSGKSLTCRAILGLLPRGAAASGEVTVNGEGQQRAGGGRAAPPIAMIFQDPLASLNPLLRVGDSIAQVLRARERLGRREARREAIAALARVGIRDPARQARQYPHRLSGGMRQRALMAMALALRPQVLLADEPTSAVDVVVQQGILALLQRLRREYGMSLLLVSHDLGVVASVCDRIAVMYAGEIVEQGETRAILTAPAHPYTAGLLASLPSAAQGRLTGIAGAPPEAGIVPTGCAFADRCPKVQSDCLPAPIALRTIDDRDVRCLHPNRVQEHAYG